VIRHRVVFSRLAEEQLVEIVAWMAHESVATALRWQVRFEAAVGSLATFPRRCPLAPESAALVAAGVATGDVRQLVHGSHRILFTVEGRVVRILHVRHAARRRVGEEE
jgi:plasmid stabilization system protein ParE